MMGNKGVIYTSRACNIYVAPPPHVYLFRRPQSGSGKPRSGAGDQAQGGSVQDGSTREAAGVCGGYGSVGNFPHLPPRREDPSINTVSYAFLQL